MLTAQKKFSYEILFSYDGLPHSVEFRSDKKLSESEISFWATETKEEIIKKLRAEKQREDFLWEK